jgi:predicted RNase H-like nuclease (RuvC/YqgF family)
MQSVQESKQELEAAIRYAENAISSANQTIESMEFRQEMAKKQYAEQTGREQALEAKVQGQYDDIVQLQREVELYTKKYNELAKQKDDLEAQVNALEQPERPTMPVIPKAVAIAIFREGVAHGVEAACTELEGGEVLVEESEYVGGFEVSFSKTIDLDEELDLDWMRDKVGRYDEGFVVDALKNLCADKEFECRIHGVDDNED